MNDRIRNIENINSYEGLPPEKNICDQGGNQHYTSRGAEIPGFKETVLVLIEWHLEWMNCKCVALQILDRFSVVYMEAEGAVRGA